MSIKLPAIARPLRKIVPKPSALPGALQVAPAAGAWIALNTVSAKSGGFCRFFVRVSNMIRSSFYQQTTTGALPADFTLVNYFRLASVDLYQKVLFTTIRVSLLTTIGSMLLAYPVALVMVRGNALVSRVLAVIV